MIRTPTEPGVSAHFAIVSITSSLLGLTGLISPNRPACAWYTSSA